MYQKKKQQRLYGRAVWLLLVCLCAGLTGCRDRAEDFLKEANVQEEGGQSEETGTQSTKEENSSVSEKVSESTEEKIVAVTENISPIPKRKQIYVDVCGAVNRPGVYALEQGSHAFQAIDAAGGALPNAAEAYINRARELEDGQQLYVPTVEETQEQGSVWTVPAKGETAQLSDGTVSETKEKVNINTADESRLCTISGIGASKARAIISYRETNGSFSSIEEIMNVEGIKEGTFSKIKEEIVVR